MPYPCPIGVWGLRASLVGILTKSRRSFALCKDQVRECMKNWLFYSLILVEFFSIQCVNMYYSQDIFAAK